MESQEGVGTTVEVLLPASELAAASPPAPAAPSPTGRGRVLVMDDEAVIRRGVSRMLHRVGFDVECVESGAEAVETYRKALRAGQRFDAVLLDLTVPDGLGGEHCFARLRELDPDVRAIVSSGYSEDPVMADYQRHGFHGVARKPYTLEELVDALNDAMGD
jgi:CheY-like chemotaxis protein